MAPCLDAFMQNSNAEHSRKFRNLQNAPKTKIDLDSISLLFAKFDAFTSFSAIVQKDCTYPPDY